MIKSPCKYCDVRYLCCHDKCAAYQEYKAELNRLHELERKELGNLSAQIRINALMNKNQYY